MSSELLNHINKFTTLSDVDFERVISFFEPTKLAKKEILAEAGTVCTNNHFVLNGCLHMYFITEKGIKRTVQFAIENWWIADFLAYQNETKTDFYIQAVENSRLLSISYDNQEQLLREFPQMERYFRVIFQTAYGASLMKTKYLLDFSKEEIYFHFTEHFPEFVQRVPQKLIASFLGLTPEYVSEIRAKKRS